MKKKIIFVLFTFAFLGFFLKSNLKNQAIRLPSSVSTSNSCLELFHLVYGREELPKTHMTLRVVDTIKGPGTVLGAKNVNHTRRTLTTYLKKDLDGNWPTTSFSLLPKKSSAAALFEGEEFAFSTYRILGVLDESGIAEYRSLAKKADPTSFYEFNFYNRRPLKSPDDIRIIAQNGQRPKLVEVEGEFFEEYIVMTLRFSKGQEQVPLMEEKRFSTRSLLLPIEEQFGEWVDINMPRSSYKFTFELGRAIGDTTDPKLINIAIGIAVANAHQIAKWFHYPLDEVFIFAHATTRLTIRHFQTKPQLQMHLLPPIRGSSDRVLFRSLEDLLEFQHYTIDP